MEIVKQYLEKRIERLKIEAEDLEKQTDFDAEDYSDRMFIADCVRGVTKINTVRQELEQVLNLFNEEYETLKIKSENHVDRLNDVSRAIVALYSIKSAE